MAKITTMSGPQCILSTVPQKSIVAMVLDVHDPVCFVSWYSWRLLMNSCCQAFGKSCMSASSSTSFWSCASFSQLPCSRSENTCVSIPNCVTVEEDFILSFISRPLVYTNTVHTYFGSCFHWQCCRDKGLLVVHWCWLSHCVGQSE